VLGSLSEADDAVQESWLRLSRADTSDVRNLDRWLTTVVNGAAGLVSWLSDGRPFSVMAFTVARGAIVEIDVLTDPARLRRLDLTALNG
jgi:hypothetical protein